MVHQDHSALTLTSKSTEVYKEQTTNLSIILWIKVQYENVLRSSFSTLYRLNLIQLIFFLSCTCKLFLHVFYNVLFFLVHSLITPCQWFPLGQLHPGWLSTVTNRLHRRWGWWWWTWWWWWQHWFLLPFILSVCWSHGNRRDWCF